MTSIYLHQDNFLLWWKTCSELLLRKTPAQTITDPSNRQTVSLVSPAPQSLIFLHSLLAEECYILQQHTHTQIKKLNGIHEKKYYLLVWPCAISFRMLLLKER